MHLPILTDVARSFEADGYEVFADVTLEGATGREHAPDLFCEREDGWLVVTVRDVVTGRDVVDAFAMGKDCDARAACCGARVTPEATRWADRLGVALVDGPAPAPAAEPVVEEAPAPEPVIEDAPAPEFTVEATPEPAPVVTALALVPEAAPAPAPEPAVAPHLTALAAHAHALPGADARAVPLPAPAPAAPALDAGLLALAADGRVLAPPRGVHVDRVLARVPTVDFAAFAPLPAPLPLPTAFDIGVPEPVEEDAREVALADAVARWDEEMLAADAALPWTVPVTEAASPLPWTIPATPRAAPGHVPVDALTPEARAARELLWGTADAPASRWLATLAPRRVLQQ